MAEFGQGTEQVIAALLAQGDPQFFQQQVEEGRQMGGGGVGGAGDGGGNTMARMGALVGEGVSQFAGTQPPPAFEMPGRVTPASVMKKTVQAGQQKVNSTKANQINRAVPQDLRMAEADYYQAGADLQATQTRRFKGGILGFGESVYDLVRSKDAQAEFLDARNNLDDKTIEYEQNLLNQQAEIWTQERDKYVSAVTPLLETKIPMQPGTDPAQYKAQIQQVASQAFNQNLAIKDLFPDQAEVMKPVPIKFIGADGAEYEKFIDPNTGASVKGENFEPRLIARPSDKTSGTKFTTTTVLDETGKWEVTYGPYNDQGVKAEVSRIKVGPPSEVKEENSMKPIGTMPGENRKNMGLVVGANVEIAEAMPLLFDTDGDYKRFAVNFPGSQEAAAYRTMKAAISKVLRLETGAAKSDEEIAEMAEQYLPTMTDSSTMARQKQVNLDRYIKSMHEAYTVGYDLTEAPNMQYRPVSRPWDDTPVAQAAVLEEENAALDAELAAALQAAGITPETP